MKEKIAIGGDRCGYDYKEKIKEHLQKMGYDVIDVGTVEKKPSDSPVFAQDVGKLVTSGICKYGILICATGTGISIAANKIKGIMCGIGYDDDVTRKMREHNDANVVAFGEEHMLYDDVERRVEIFLKAKFIGKHHELRVQQIKDLENGKEITQSPIINPEWRHEVEK